jgi:RHS repeat-associated protein
VATTADGPPTESGSVPVGTGPVPSATFLNFPVSDRVSLQVNVGSGDALLTTSDLTLPEAKGNLTIGNSYNSLLVGSAFTQGGDGNGWRQREGVDVRLYSGSNGSLTLLAEDGMVGTFTAPTGSGTTYGSPAVFHATLSDAPAPTGDCGGDAYQLTWHTTGEVMCFESNGLLDALVDRDGNFNAYTYNANGQETQMGYYPSGETTPNETINVSYTGNYLTGLTESGGSAGTKTVTYGINSSGDVTSVKQADGTTITLGYDGSHDLTSIKNGAGATTKLTYNSARQVTSVAQPYGSAAATATTRLSYVSSTETQVAAPTTNQSDPVSSVPNTTYTINSQDLVTKAVDPAGDTRSASYTPFDGVATATNGLTGGTTTNAYTANAGESLTSSQSPTGATAQLAYANSNSGNDPTAEYQPSSATDAQSNIVAYTYEGAGDLYSSSSALPATATVVPNWDDGTPATSTDPDGGQTTYSYNSLHQLTAITPPTSGSLKPIAITYDGFGRISTATSGAGNKVTYAYDLADRIKQEAFTGGSRTLTVTYAYDGAGNLKSQTDASGTTSWTYDGRNQVLTKNAASGGGTLTYTYDADGNMLSSADAGGTTSYTYNDLDLLASLTDPAGELWEFTYNKAGERTDTYFATNAADTTWAVKYVTSYDASGRISRIQALGNSGATTLSDISYCYSKYVSGQACPTSQASTDRSLVQYSVNNQTSVVSQYTYDSGNRLTGVTNDNGTTYSYSYDNDGNIKSGAKAGSLGYNTSNQVDSSGYGYDGAGALTADPSNGTLTYNDAGQLASASAANGGGAGSGSETFTYAGATQTQPLSDGSATKITYGLADQYGQAWVDSYTTGGTANYVIRDQQGDSLGMVRSGKSYIFLTDNVGSVTAIAGTCGCADATYAYTPYGALATKGAGSGGSLVTENLIGYTGALTDTFTAGSTGYIHDGARWYNPGTGAFNSQDANSYLANPANGNRYAYAADNPANYIDPTGSSCGSALETSAAAVFLGGTAEGGVVATEASLSEAAILDIGVTTLSVVSGGIGALVAGAIIGSFLLGC